MLYRKDRTMETYIKAGAYARLLFDIGNKAAEALSCVLPAKDTDRLLVLLNKIDWIKSKADTQLFTDYPGLGHEGTSVFYGPLNYAPENELDERVISEARRMAAALFGDADQDGSYADSGVSGELIP